MKKKLLFLFAFNCCLLGWMNAQTTIAGGMVSGLWKKVNSPFLVQGSIMVPKDSTLRIEPGVKLDFKGFYKFQINGRLLAVGTSNDTILITATDTALGWQGIRFDKTPSTDTSKFLFCTVEGVKKFYKNGTPDEYGGAFYFDGFSNAIISHCLIRRNQAEIGGGIYCVGNSNPVITDNSIVHNKSTGRAGGIYYNYSKPTICRNYIAYNIAGYGGGGGIYVYADLPGAEICGNIISNNYAARQFMAGGIFCSACTTTIANNIISNNSATSGAGIYADGNPNPTIINNLISNNYTYHIDLPDRSAGGAICLYSSYEPVISNNVISNNYGEFGGGIFSSYGFNSINNTIVNNAAIRGGGVCVFFGGTPLVKNTILWGNTASVSGNQVYLEVESADPNFLNCDIQGGSAAFGLNNNFYTGVYSNNIDSLPMFTLPSAGSGESYNGLLADWTLKKTSSCINKGNPTGPYPATDKAGAPRIVNAIIDIGAFEFQDIFTSITTVVKNEIEIYPNPFSDYALLKLNSNYSSLDIYNAQGQQVRSINVSYLDQFKLEKQDLTPGIYFMRLTTDNRSNIVNSILMLQ